MHALLYKTIYMYIDLPRPPPLYPVGHGEAQLSRPIGASASGNEQGKAKNTHQRPGLRQNTTPGLISLKVLQPASRAGNQAKSLDKEPNEML